MRHITIQECFESLNINNIIDDKSISEIEADELNNYIKNNNLDRDNIIWERNKVTFINYVGYIKLSTVAIEILPKININNNSSKESRKALINMLVRCGVIKVNYSEINQLYLYKMNLNEILSYLFANKLKNELIKGLYQEYVYAEENTGTLKGSIMVKEHIRNITTATPKVFCRYEKFSIDNRLNQILAYCIKKLLREIRNLETIKILKHIQAYFTDVTEKEVSNVDIYNYKFTRLNSRFEDVFILAKILLCGYSSIGDKGKDKSFSILFRMDELFEKYIAKILKVNLENLVVHSQHSKYKLLISENSNKGIFQLRPDIVIEVNGKKSIIIDIKWKRISSEHNRHGVKREDLYQMYAYLTRYTDVKTVILLYPYNSYINDNSNKCHESWMLDNNREKKIRVYTVNLENESTTIKNLKMIINDVCGIDLC